jgi:hypothetical protein
MLQLRSKKFGTEGAAHRLRVLPIELLPHLSMDSL